VDLSLTGEQRDIVESVRSILGRIPPPASVVAELQRDRLTALADAGFLDLTGLGGTPVDATLVIEEAAAAGTCAPVGARALVAPAVSTADLPLVLGLMSCTAGELVRFGGDAEAFLVVDGDRALVVPRADADVVPQSVRWGYPAARVRVAGGDALGPGSGPALLRAWRTALAAEAGGLMKASLLKAAGYVKEREQFGRAIGRYQSVQHRLARGWVLAEGATWLARRAAFFDHDDVAAAAAATYACEGMREVFHSVHQVVGAMGITDEFGLTRLTGKLAYLHTELGGAAANARALAQLRWVAPGGGRSGEPTERVGAGG
jgi:alkylation response protein AidB-like acyl-CoA dehydrogenase